MWTIGPDDMVFDAIHLMDKKNVGALPVLDGGRLVGILLRVDAVGDVADFELGVGRLIPADWNLEKGKDRPFSGVSVF